MNGRKSDKLFLEKPEQRTATGHTSTDSQTHYRVIYLVWDLGWVDSDLGCSTMQKWPISKGNGPNMN